MKNWILISLLMLGFSSVFAQDFPEGISYQAQVRASDGAFLSDVTIGVEFNILATTMTGTIVWQEKHSVDLNNLGHFSAVIGTGASTGVGTSPLFSEIDWAATTYYLEMLVDENNIGDFVSSMTQQMMAVPFAFHSKTTSQQFALSELMDVDVTGIEVGDILKWNGSQWVASEDLLPDTVTYAYSSAHAEFADTATYAINCEIPELVDSASYSYYSDTANYAPNGIHSDFADFADFADTASVALFAYNNWGLFGNSGTSPLTNFLGTIDSTDLVIKSYNLERMRIKANGRVGIGTTNPLAEFHVNNVNGVLFTGTFGTGTIPATGAGARMMWHPRKAAFRVGLVTGTQWDDASIGNYSFAAGYNSRAIGAYSVAFGFTSTASGEGAFAVGNQANASGFYSFAAGHNPEATGSYSIALGRGASARANSAIAIGYHPSADAPYALSLGNYTYAHGENSVALGYHAHSLHNGTFVYSDQSDGIGNTLSTAENQFMVKASGGTIFYTNVGLTTGVRLLPGAGAWSILSDRNQKENIVQLNGVDYLARLKTIDVYSWSYKSQDSTITHIGPMAQDFFTAFELGTDSTTINSGDFDGVNLLLLKALDEKMTLIEIQQSELIGLKNELILLQEQREKLYQMLLGLENKTAISKVD
jgi:hypothetical protein